MAKKANSPKRMARKRGRTTGKRPPDPGRRQLLKRGWSLAITALLMPLAGKAAGCAVEDWEYSDWVNDSPDWVNWENNHSDWADQYNPTWSNYSDGEWEDYSDSGWDNYSDSEWGDHSDWGDSYGDWGDWGDSYGDHSDWEDSYGDSDD